MNTFFLFFELLLSLFSLWASMACWTVTRVFVDEEEEDDDYDEDDILLRVVECRERQGINLRIDDGAVDGDDE